MTTNSGDKQEQERRFGQLVAQAWLEPDFKARLLSDPVAMVRAAGLDVPAGRRIEVLEAGPGRSVLMLQSVVLEAEPAADDLAWNELVARAAADPGFKARLVSDPALVLRQAGIEVPAGTVVEVVEPDETRGYLILPPQPEDGVEVGDEVVGYHCRGCGGCRVDANASVGLGSTGVGMPTGVVGLQTFGLFPQ